MKVQMTMVCKQVIWLSTAIAILFLTGCSSYLRASFCRHPLASFPEELQGAYDVTVPAQSAAWGSNTLLKTMQVELKNDRLIASSNFPGFSSNGKICKVSGRYFAEQLNSDGTFSVSEFTKFSDGMIISALSVDLELARQAHLQLQYLPKEISFLGEDESNQISFGFNPSVFVLDNRNMTSESVLGFTAPVSYQIVLRKHRSPIILTGAKHTIQLQNAQP